MPQSNQHHFRRIRRNSGITMLLALTAIAMIGTGALYGAKGNWGFMDVDGLMNMGMKAGKTSDDALPLPPDYEMAGVKLGMSPEAVRREHPDMSLSSVTDGVQRGSYFMNGASYSVWFLNVNGKKQAYRMRVDKSFKGRSDHEILSSIAKTYGRPASSNCSVNQVAINKACNFSWLGKKGVSLSINMRNVPTGNGKRLDVTMDVIDTLLEGKRRRLQSQLEEKRLRRPGV